MFTVTVCIAKNMMPSKKKTYGPHGQSPTFAADLPRCKMRCFGLEDTIVGNQ